MNNDLSKQEYLKRYLEDDKEGKKRKKKVKPSKCIIPKIKIVDQDISIKSIKFGTKEEIEEDESPVVAEIVDERPVEVKSKELYQSSRWKRIGEEKAENIEINANDSPTHHRSLENRKRLLKSNKSPTKSTRRHDSDSDLSPVRVTQRHDSDSDCSPPRRHKNAPADSRRQSGSRSKRHVSKSKNSDSDISPERPGRRRSDSDLSPERCSKPRTSRSGDVDSDISPPRKSTNSNRGDSPAKTGNHRPSKTLSGLKAGLQNAATLREETKELRKREAKQIRELDEELSGRNAAPILRDRQTGQRRNIDEENRVDEEKEKKIQEQKQKYTEWGKGIEQSESKKQKLSEDLYEMSKPMARYCDDEDLDERLREEIHDEDPMAQYMRKKKQKTISSVYPTYSGPPPPPNRFQIPPGYRWDGVDRSNGFEKKYFEQKSSKKATEEEAYLWSIQDM